MIEETLFRTALADAYDHLYDFAHLRSHSLAGVMMADSDVSRKERARKLHQLLLTAIEELAPEPQAPIFSRDWRRHRLMTLRYVEGLDPQAVADQLGISRRHYYREQEATIDTLSTILWQRHSEKYVFDTQKPASTVAEYRDLIRLEAIRAQTAERESLSKIVHDVCDVLAPLFRQRNLQTSIMLPVTMPLVVNNLTVFRQLLLSIFDYLSQQVFDAILVTSADVEESDVTLSISISLNNATEFLHYEAKDEQLQLIEELAILSEIKLRAIKHNQQIVGFTLPFAAVVGLC